MNYNCAAALQTRSLGVFGASPHRNLSPRISGHPGVPHSLSHTAAQEKPVCEESFFKKKQTQKA